MAKKNIKQALSENHWIVKSNTLNEIRNNKMTATQMRFFSIYLSKINPENIDSRVVTFKLSEYARIMQFKQMNITRLRKAADDLLKLTVAFYDRTPSGAFAGMTVCQLFKRFKLYNGTDNEWYVSIDCHDDVVTQMFDLKRYYFKYQLWNSLRLTSSNQQRMYEILKQYEQAGAREISIQDLREFLGISKKEYPRWDRFKARILDSSQQALSDFTDIKFTYETIKKGKGGKVTGLKFKIERNDNYIDQLTLNDFIDEQFEPLMPENLEEIEVCERKFEFLSDACKEEFSESEMQILFGLIARIVPFNGSDVDIQRYEYLHRKYNELNYRAEKTKIKNRFAYFKKIIEADL